MLHNLSDLMASPDQPILFCALNWKISYKAHYLSCLPTLPASSASCFATHLHPSSSSICWLWPNQYHVFCNWWLLLWHCYLGGLECRLKIHVAGTQHEYQNFISAHAHLQSSHGSWGQCKSTLFSVYQLCSTGGLFTALLPASAFHVDICWYMEEQRGVLSPNTPHCQT